MITETLSPQARTALLSVGTNRQGATPRQRDAGPEVMWELEAAGLIGPGGGLTRKGSIVRQREVTRSLEDAFPL